jgi:hypothetical protein
MFGRHLVQRGVVSDAIVLAAVRRQAKLRHPLGEIALMEEVLTEDQVHEVLEAQESDERPFGELAIEAGYLTPETLRALLDTQSRGIPRIGEILVNMGAFDRRVLERELRLAAAFSAGRRDRVSPSWTGARVR